MTAAEPPRRPLSLIGAPTDVGAGAKGARMGPEALRVAGFQEALEAHGLEVVDRGNLGDAWGIGSFIAYGLLCTLVGYFAPAPPRNASEENAA